MAKGNLTLRKDSELKAQASELFEYRNGHFLQTGS